MRIATYNIWNSTLNWPQRVAALAEELVILDADVVALQEAPTQAREHQTIVEFLCEKTNYPYVLHMEYPDPPDDGDRPEGLAFLSRFPVRELLTSWEAPNTASNNNWAVKIVIDWTGVALGVTNLHLDWVSATGREEHLARIVEDVVDKLRCECDLLCGDFNEDPDGPVGRFLQGIQSDSLSGTLWRDLAHENQQANGAVAEMTLDPPSNPRWSGIENKEPSRRFDRIYLRSGSGVPPPRVIRVGLFGKEPTNRYRIVPSDHYGVFVDFDLPSGA